MSEFERAMEEYFHHFGVSYPFAVGWGYPGKTDEENIALIRKSMEENKPIVFEPDYADDCDY